MGMSAEFILGVHTEMTFDGQRLAGMYPHQQVKVVETAGLAVRLNNVSLLPQLLRFQHPGCHQGQQRPQYF